MQKFKPKLFIIIVTYICLSVLFFILINYEYCSIYYSVNIKSKDNIAYEVYLPIPVNENNIYIDFVNNLKDNIDSLQYIIEQTKYGPALLLVSQDKSISFDYSYTSISLLESVNIMFNEFLTCITNKNNQIGFVINCKTEETNSLLVNFEYMYVLKTINSINNYNLHFEQVIKNGNNFIDEKDNTKGINTGGGAATLIFFIYLFLTIIYISIAIYLYKKRKVSD